MGGWGVGVGVGVPVGGADEEDKSGAGGLEDKAKLEPTGRASSAMKFLRSGLHQPSKLITDNSF